MIKSLKITVILFFLTLLFNVVSVTTVPACKDIISVGNVNEGDYNLLMKVRDPSRSGLQVLSIIPESYEYTYNHPRNGKEMTFTTEYKFIGGGTVSGC